MKPCSAYCEPEKGVHTYIAFTEADNSTEGTRERFVGLTRIVDNRWGGEACYPLPAKVTVLAVDEAPECNEEPPPRCDLGSARPLLVTIQVLP